MNLYQQPGSNNLIGCKLEVGVASLFIQHGKDLDKYGKDSRCPSKINMVLHRMLQLLIGSYHGKNMGRPT